MSSPDPATQRRAPVPLTSEPLWTVEQAAAYLGVSPRYVRDSDCPRLRLPGNGAARQPLVRFAPPVVRAWAEQWRTDRPAHEGEAA